MSLNMLWNPSRPLSSQFISPVQDTFASFPPPATISFLQPTIPWILMPVSLFEHLFRPTEFRTASHRVARRRTRRSGRSSSPPTRGTRGRTRFVSGIDNNQGRTGLYADLIRCGPGTRGQSDSEDGADEETGRHVRLGSKDGFYGGGQGVGGTDSRVQLQNERRSNRRLAQLDGQPEEGEEWVRLLGRRRSSFRDGIRIATLAFFTMMALMGFLCTYLLVFVVEPLTRKEEEILRQNAKPELWKDVILYFYSYGVFPAFYQSVLMKDVIRDPSGTHHQGTARKLSAQPLRTSGLVHRHHERPRAVGLSGRATADSRRLLHSREQASTPLGQLLQEKLRRRRLYRGPEQFTFPLGQESTGATVVEVVGLPDIQLQSLPVGGVLGRELKLSSRSPVPSPSHLVVHVADPLLDKFQETFLDHPLPVEFQEGLNRIEEGMTGRNYTVGEEELVLFVVARVEVSVPPHGWVVVEEEVAGHGPHRVGPPHLYFPFVTLSKYPPTLEVADVEVLGGHRQRIPNVVAVYDTETEKTVVGTTGHRRSDTWTDRISLFGRDSLVTTADSSGLPSTPLQSNLSLHWSLKSLLSWGNEPITCMIPPPGRSSRWPVLGHSSIYSNPSQDTLQRQT